MSTIRFWWLELAILYHEWALMELTSKSPSSNEVPYLITRIADLRDQRSKPAQPMDADAIVTGASIAALLIFFGLAVTGVIK